MAIIARVPGINGAIEIDGAASEDTLRALLNAISKEANNRRRFDTDVAAELKKQSGAARDAEAALSSMSRTAGVASSTTQSAFGKLTDLFQERQAMIGAAIGDVGVFARNLLTTSQSIATTWVKNFSDISRIDPINQAAGLLNKGVGLAVDGVNVLGNMFGSVLPRQLQGKSAAFIRGITGFAGSAIQDINNLMAQELKRTADAMKTFNTEGGSYAQGMTTLRINALEAGLSVDQFAAVIKGSRDDIITFGGNLGDGSTKLSQVMEQLSTQTGRSGKSLREELLNMGVGFEEQGAISASYMAQLRQLIGVEKVRTLGSAELAKGTRQYAEDLKILQEYTGKDAKKIMEKARQETMRGALLSTLATDQQKSLMETFSGMEAIPDAVRDNLKNALMQQLSGNTITDPVVAQSEEMMAFVKKLADQVRAGTEGMSTKTVELTGEMAKTVAEQGRLGQGIGVAADRVAIFSTSVDSNVAKLSQAYNALSALAIDPEAVRRSQQAAKDSAEGSDKLQSAMSTAVIAAQDFGVKIGKLTTEGMLPYADLLKNTVITTTRTIEHTLDLFVGKISAQDFMAKMTEVVRTVMKEVMGERAPARERQGARAEGGPVAEGRTYLVGEKGPELFVANRNGIIIPNANRALTDLTPKLTQKQESVAPRTDPELPEAIASAFGTAINGPNGFTQIMSEVKKQIADDNRMSQTMLQGQIDKLTDLVNAMQDQVRASENIANALS